MLSWFAPKCPCDVEAKKWLESRLTWICREFPSNIYTDRAMFLPVRFFFPEPFEPTEAGLRELVERVCEYMDVPAHRVTVRVHHDPNRTWFVNADGDLIPHAAGTYESSRAGHVLTFDTEELHHPGALVATIAHELAHARLLGERRLRTPCFDNELLTDLTAVALGFGVFLANSPRVWSSQYSEWPGSSLLKPEYMTPPMYGYALGLAAWCEGKQRPQWCRFLGPSVTADFKQSVRFLFKTGDTSFRPPLRAVAPQSDGAFDDGPAVK
jgi:hypothetical protein